MPKKQLPAQHLGYGTRQVHWSRCCCRRRRQRQQQQSLARTDPVDIVATPDAMLMWLAATKDDRSTLSRFNGVHHDVLVRVLSYTESARFPCNCCRGGDGSRLIFCHVTRKQYYRPFDTDISKLLEEEEDGGDEDTTDDDDPGEGVPERLILRRNRPGGKILFASEDVHVWRCCGSITTYNPKNKNYHIEGIGMSSASPVNSPRQPWYVACTESGFYSPIVSFQWDDFEAITKLCTNIDHYGGRKREVMFEVVSLEESEDATVRSNEAICFSFRSGRVGSLLLKVVRSNIRSAYLQYCQGKRDK